MKENLGESLRAIIATVSEDDFKLVLIRMVYDVTTSADLKKDCIEMRREILDQEDYEPTDLIGSHHREEIKISLMEQFL